MRNNYLLDADETILDFLRSSRESFAQAMAWAGMERLASDYEKFRAVNDALWKAYERGEVTKSRLVVERFARFFAAEGVEADAAAVNGGISAPSARRGTCCRARRSFCGRCARGGRYISSPTARPPRSTAGWTRWASAAILTASSSRTRSVLPSRTSAFSNTCSRMRPPAARTASSSATLFRPTSPARAARGSRPYSTRRAASPTGGSGRLCHA